MRPVLAAAALFAAAPAATAGQLLFWDFENTTSVGNVSTSVGLPGTPGVTGFMTQTGGGPAEDFGPSAGIVFLTRFMNFYSPYAEFTTTTPTSLTDITFQHFHNHNPGYPTQFGYDIQMQLDTGSGYADIGSPLFVSSANSGATDSIGLGGIVLGPGTYSLRWQVRNLAGPDTNTEFFALNDVSLNGQAVPEPGSVALAGAGAVGLFGYARRRRAARA